MGRQRRRKRKRKLSKAEALRIHSFRRFLERYPHLDITEARKEIIQKIRTNKSTPVEKQSTRVSIHDVELESGDVVRVAYDRNRGRIITFLYRNPRDYLTEEDHADEEDEGEGGPGLRAIRPAGGEGRGVQLGGADAG